MGRMDYTVEPGLYALGNPNEGSPVLVTANYKMSFDRLREAIPGRDAWVLVLDTKGINVWCSAGKGAFGTGELVQRILRSGLDRVVSHRQLILPQLAGPGVAAHQVKKQSGFKVIYGPIRAKDLAVFLSNGMKATPDMRRKSFTTGERVVLIPIELVGAFKGAFLLIAFLFLTGLLGSSESLWERAAEAGSFSVQVVVIGMLAGAVLTPFMLPWLPGRAFSVKGVIPGFLGFLTFLALRWEDWGAMAWSLRMISGFLLILAVSAYLAMNFTGASTYTSLSGVRKEMRWAVPAEIGAGLAGLGFFVASRFFA
jgi:acetyl-CoA decarbonylase/synthase complex subunit gamma